MALDAWVSLQERNGNPQVPEIKGGFQAEVVTWGWTLQLREGLLGSLPVSQMLSFNTPPGARDKPWGLPVVRS